MSARLPGRGAVACAGNAAVVNSLFRRASSHRAQGERWRAVGFSRAANAVAAHPIPVVRGNLASVRGIGKTIGRIIEDTVRQAVDSPQPSRSVRARTATELAQRRMESKMARRRKVKDEGADTSATTENAAPQPETGCVLVSFDEAQRFQKLVRDLARQVSPEATVELVGEFRRCALYGRKVELLITAPGMTSATPETDEALHVTLGRIVRLGIAQGVFAGRTARVGHLGYLVHAPFVDDVVARSKARLVAQVHAANVKQHEDGQLQQSEPAQSEGNRQQPGKTDVSSDATMEENEQSDDASVDHYTQPLHLWWSASDRFYARLLCATGPAGYVEQLQNKAARNGMHLSVDSGLVSACKTHIDQGEAGGVMACASEAEVFEKLGAQSAPAHDRIDPSARLPSIFDAL
jgi:DNA polymerase/3'-5' exonuclease PolX